VNFLLASSYSSNPEVSKVFVLNSKTVQGRVGEGSSRYQEPDTTGKNLNEAKLAYVMKSENFLSLICTYQLKTT